MARNEHICGLYFARPDPEYPRRTQRHYLPQVQLISNTTITPVCYTTKLIQTFRNPTSEIVSKARYTFPLYDGVAVSSYTITYGEKTLRGIVRQKDAAKKTYEAAIDRGETASLLESLPAGIFGVTLGNLPANADVQVDIVYCGELKHDAAIDGLRYMLPTIIAPRYGEYPGQLLESTATNDGGISITVDIDMDGSAIRKVQSPSHPIAVSMGEISTEDVQSSFNPSKASTTLALGTTELAGDFVLQLLIDEISKPQAIIEHHPNLKSRAIMATFVPRFNLDTNHPEIVFIADQSGSMQGPKNKALVSALKVFIKSLPTGVRFNICAFGTGYEMLWPKSQAYNEENMEAAIRFVETFKAQYGGTQLLEPVKAVFEQRLGNMPLEVMLLTDGEIWGERALFEYIDGQLRRECVDARVFGLGIGKSVSHTLVEGIARSGEGFAQFVTQDEETDKKVIRMLKGALFPHLTDRTMEVRFKRDPVGAGDDEEFEMVERVDYCLNIEEMPSANGTKGDAEAVQKRPVQEAISLFDPSADLDMPIQASDTDRFAHLPAVTTPKILQAPSALPSLFPFNRTTVYFILGPDAPQKPVSSITLCAKSPQGPLQLTIDLGKSTEGTIVHELAARRSIQELETGCGWLNAAKNPEGALVKDKHQSRFDELIEREAVRLGERFQVASKWTSFVAVEDNPTGNSQSSDSARPQATQQSSSNATFGSAAPPPMACSMAPTTSNMDLSGGFGAFHANVIHNRSTMTATFGAHVQAEESEESESEDDDMGFGLYDGDDSDSDDDHTAAPRFLREASDSDSDDDTATVPASAPEPAQREQAAVVSSPDISTKAGARAAVHTLIGLQKFAGSWEWDDDIFTAIQLRDKVPEFDGIFGSKAVMATALAVAFLESKLTESEDVWEMAVAKAKTWLSSQMSVNAVDGLVERAKGLF